MPFPPGQSTPSTRRRTLQGAALMLAGSLLCGTAAFAQAKKEVVIGYQDMVVPWRHAQETKEVERRTGYQVTYRKLGSGAEVVRALASGAIQIGEAGSSPIAAALSQGVPIEVFWVLDNINDAEALVARNGSGVNSLADLKGKKIGLPFVSTTHFHALVALQDAGIDPRTVRIVNLRPPEILAAWERGDIDATFVWDPVLAKVKQSGKVLVTSGQIAARTGKATFDALAVNKEFARTHDAFLTQFVQVLADADKAYTANKAAWTADAAPVKSIAKWSGAEAQAVPASLALYAFVPPAEQAATQWLGGAKDSGVAKSLAATAAFLKEQGTVQSVLPDYSVGVNPTWVQRAR
ncbi:taurine ABC transporter substrate-binding protein [Paracidovorax avenae]|uniref:taurine ABC transporter substrate-binding protein n=1 Tax=Paracidovorax avenae TaxID=80867 RepID=UPI000D159D96|nr:taurine ABC transporter substrate-binding protein [Paracidovorax avenae]AVS76647.1 taurine ABC transporter substrate-binding protein [Paracidovorax avenae]AVS79698.1 taurine ABC transporter substrate-binding protein [Paracidovorax avenae]AVT14814.1 taurine ABC transporter substrate-binding protein [Paracidovorax avenae]AVT18625.1 taurine ABC transporter substrate-binding protein [Paracidovorax avenae]